MAAHNAAASVGDAIDSILSQSFTAWMLLVVDDGSTDATYGVVSDYASRDSRLRLIRNHSNRGLACSLNAAIAQIRSDLIARMDADDRSLPDRLQVQTEFMNDHRDVDVLGTAAILLGCQTASHAIFDRPERHEDLVKEIYLRNPFIHPSVMFRRAFVNRMGGYAEDLRRAQDYDLWLRAYRSSVFHNLQRPLIEYRMRRRITLGHAASTARVLWRSARREGIAINHAWRVIRPLVAYFARYAGYKARY